jgi:hypothetical protein
VRRRFDSSENDSTRTLESFDFGFLPKLNKVQLFDLPTG